MRGVWRGGFQHHETPIVGAGITPGSTPERPLEIIRLKLVERGGKRAVECCAQMEGSVSTVPFASHRTVLIITCTLLQLLSKRFLQDCTAHLPAA